MLKIRERIKSKRFQKIALIISSVLAFGIGASVIIAKYVNVTDSGPKSFIAPDFYFNAVTEGQKGSAGLYAIVYVTNYEDSLRMTDYDIAYEITVEGGAISYHDGLQEGSGFVLAGGEEKRDSFIIEPYIDGTAPDTKEVTVTVKSLLPYEKEIEIIIVFNYNTTIPSFAIVPNDDDISVTFRVCMNDYGGTAVITWSEHFIPLMDVWGVLKAENLAPGSSVTTDALMPNETYEFVFIGTDMEEGYIFVSPPAE